MTTKDGSQKSQSEYSIQSRKVSLQVLLAVLKDGKSLSHLDSLYVDLSPRDTAFAKMLSFGVLRHLHTLSAQLKPLLQKPLKSKDLDIQLIMLMAVYQIEHTRVPEYAAVDAAVSQLRKSKKQWAGKLVNGVLRNYLRQSENREPLDEEEASYAHPQWIIDRVQIDWPKCWQDILHNNNQQAPMCLRVNRLKYTCKDYQQALSKQGIESVTVKHADSALILQKPCDVKQLPDFSEGAISVQDYGAQFAAHLLNPQPADRVLDACAAPGGKTAHLFERQPNITLSALDVSDNRLDRVRENCQRLGFAPELVCADASDTDAWWSGEPYDRILLDVPCSASGVIRRHPDIKHLRRSDDISQLVKLQQKILLANWTLLAPGGYLLYATCSVFKAENEQQIEWFLQQHSDAQLAEMPLADNIVANMPLDCRAGVGLQLFPQIDSHDGFYYALLQKKQN